MVMLAVMITLPLRMPVSVSLPDFTSSMLALPLMSVTADFLPLVKVKVAPTTGLLVLLAIALMLT